MCRGSSSLLLFTLFISNIIAEIAQLVEHDLAKVGVASSSLVFRSDKAAREGGFICIYTSVSFVFFVSFAVELVRVVNIVPNAVEASGYRCNRSHECIPHPNGKYRVLLSQGLTGTNGIVVTGSDVFPRPELYDAANKRYAGYAKLVKCRYFAVDDTLHGNPDGNGQCHGPQIECQVLAAEN